MVNLGPTVNIDRDPRWERSLEAFTEDPYLNAAVTVPEIDGVQSQGEMSQAKHFAVYNQETSGTPPPTTRSSASGPSMRSTCRLLGRYAAGPCLLGDVRLQLHQRAVRVPERLPAALVVVDAGAPVVMPWLSQVAAVLDAWYPGESNGTALAIATGSGTVTG